MTTTKSTYDYIKEAGDENFMEIEGFGAWYSWDEYKQNFYGTPYACRKGRWAVRHAMGEFRYIPEGAANYDEDDCVYVLLNGKKVA